MQPYRVTKVYGITYNMHRVLLPLEIKGIHTMPLRKMEEVIFGSLPNNGDDPFVRLEIIPQRI